MIVPALDREHGRALVSRFNRQRVLVVGDAMLDRFITGSVTRISPEAPVPVVRFQSEQLRLGGAANVAHNLAALGANVTLIGLVGQDESGRKLRAQIQQSGISTDGLIEDARRPTIEKVRIVTDRNQQVARIDYEDDADASPAMQERLIEAIRTYGRDAAALVASDYLKGTITKAVVQALVAMKAHGGAPLLVDPKIPHIDCYEGATLITPNHHEAEAATHRRIRSDEEARLAAVEFRTLARCEATLITRGEHGMWLSGPSVEGAIPAVARQVSDVTGAGDTVVATLALVLAASGSLADAAILANHAAGVVVGKFGTATVSREELLAAISA